jgi:hypothetical protein
MAATGISADQAKAFLEAYASDFQRQDKDAVADRYAYPAHVVRHDGGVALAQAQLTWDLHGEGDRPLYQFEATYMLALINNALKIVQVISENEQPKFMGVMRERG